MNREGSEVARPRPRKFVRPILWRIVVLASLYGNFTAAFFIEHYSTLWAHVTLPSYVSLLIAVTIALLLVALEGALVINLTGMRRQDAWQSVVDAIRQISQGNFRVRLDPKALTHGEGTEHPVHQLVESINEMASELGQLEELRQQFIANVSHELQSPLSAIIGYTELLRSLHPNKTEELPYLDIIHTESMRLSRLTENLLKLTSLESGYHPMHAELHAVDSQIREAIVRLEPLWSGKMLRLNILLPHIQIVGDIDLLYQVWTNLLTNAIKFTPTEGAITVTGEQQPDRITINISDTGIGIPIADQPRIFERFYKADSSRNRAISGSGLGLAIVKKIIAMHGGDIAVRSQEGSGTTMTVHLPSPNLVV